MAKGVNLFFSIFLIIIFRSFCFVFLSGSMNIQYRKRQNCFGYCATTIIFLAMEAVCPPGEFTTQR